MKEVFAWSFYAIRIWLYPEKPSMKENKACLAVLSTKTSIWGKGKSSLGWLYSSPDTQHTFFFSILLGIGTVLANHSG